MTKVNTREMAALMVQKIMDQGEYSHVLLRRTLAACPELEKRDRAFITRMVTGTVERCLFLDYGINRVASTRVSKMKPFIRAVLRISAYQIFYMDSVEDRAACNEGVNLVKKHGLRNLSGFANGVLRALIRNKDQLLALEGIDDPAERESLTYSVPRWITGRWHQMFSADAVRQILEGISEEAPLTVRINQSLASTEQVKQSLEQDGVSWKPGPWFPGSLILSGSVPPDQLKSFRRGWIQIQDTSSQTVGAAADPEAGCCIIDVCAAPGGKTMDVTDRLRGTGHVWACDLTERKVSLIRENLERTGFSNVETVVHDACVYEEKWEQKADLVIADLPCSGLGVIGRKPDIRYRVTPEEITGLQRLQRQILSVVSRYVKPGGRLIYSTCTITREENEENVRWIQTHLPFVLTPLTGTLPEGLRGGTAEKGWLQLLPGVHGCDGFFLSQFRRI